MVAHRYAALVDFCEKTPSSSTRGKIMPIINIKKGLIASALLVLMGSTAHATTLWVNCGAKGGLNSIGAALKESSENSHGPITINVSGACNENVQIKNLNQLTLNAINSASVTDTTNGVIETIGIYESTGITINGLTVNGGSDAISVAQSAVALHGVTAQNAVYDGVGVYLGGSVFINGATLQSNGYAGLGVFGGDVNAAGVTSQQNGAQQGGGGIVVDHGGRAQYRATDPYYEGGTDSIPAIITNNFVGIIVQNRAEINCGSCQITHNTVGGVSLDVGATATFVRVFPVYAPPAAPLTIEYNGGPGVSVGDLSSAWFPFSARNGIIQGNGGSNQIACNAATSVTRRALLFTSSTNCTN
jgi:hypothetical protein